MWLFERVIWCDLTIKPFPASCVCVCLEVGRSQTGDHVEDWRENLSVNIPRRGHMHVEDTRATGEEVRVQLCTRHIWKTNSSSSAFHGMYIPYCTLHP